MNCKTFARLTGGRFYQPRFEAEYPEVFHDIIGEIRISMNFSFTPPTLSSTAVTAS